MNQREFHRILEQHGKTPIALLHSIGFLKTKTGLGHCVFHNRHSWCHYPYGDDLKMLADSGATVVHSPYNERNRPAELPGARVNHRAALLG
jgi:cytosine/adenosine deaminase-related metal-dependent hydrolase